MHRTVVVGFGPSNLRVSNDPLAPLPLRLSLRDWVGDVRFGPIRATLRRLGLRPSELGLDLLSVALGVYTADLCSSREEYGDDSWTRHLDVEVEVSDPQLWAHAAEVLVPGLRFLSNDMWRFSFRQRTVSISELGFAAPHVPRFRTNRVSLLSGGLDSAIGAVDMLNDAEPLLLASTAGERQTAGPQNDVLRELRRNYPDTPLAHIRQHVQLPSTLRFSSESSQRARSILFLSFGTFIATSYLPDQVTLVIPENGLIALNVPTDVTRMASNSTKTTHPFFLARYRETLSALGLKIDLRDPYRFKTKGEMLAGANATALRDVIPVTVSCAKAAQLFRQSTSLLHCGSCTACIIRRAALAAGWRSADPTPGYYFTPDLYSAPILSGDPRGDDIRAFKAAAARVVEDPARAAVDVYRSGPMTDCCDEIREYAAVYVRGMREIDGLLRAAHTVGA
ncbi:MAG TPA: Qat anti-phage system QueC-like protein QatC [Candidatus Elarobacter sp.]|nr:Qat anti-phage system QueC-like protein QatC [Candidatus Elarobacter sp.]